jgi:hypothetical protein
LLTTVNNELKRKTEKTEREFEEFKIQQQEEYNKLLCWLDAVNICGLMCILVCRFDVVKLSVGCC